MSEAKYNQKLGHKVSYRGYADHYGGRELEPRPTVEYKEYMERTLGKKSKVNPMIETILDIEDRLMVSDLQWTISYYPNTKSYNIFITEPTESKNVDDDTESR